MSALDARLYARSMPQCGLNPVGSSTAPEGRILQLLQAHDNGPPLDCSRASSSVFSAPPWWTSFRVFQFTTHFRWRHRAHGGYQDIFARSIEPCSMISLPQGNAAIPQRRGGDHRWHRYAQM